MPILDGYEASKKIREAENSNSSLDNSTGSGLLKTLIIGVSGN